MEASQSVSGGTYDWQKITGTFATEPNETTFQMVIAVESATQKLWLDDVESFRLYRWNPGSIG